MANEIHDSDKREAEAIVKAVREAFDCGAMGNPVAAILAAGELKVTMDKLSSLSLDLTLDELDNIVYDEFDDVHEQ
jgi:hypothetical protein